MSWGKKICAAVLCLVSASALANKKSDTLTFGLESDLDSLDRYYSTSRTGVVIARHLFDYLLDRDPQTLQIKPLLAKSYKLVGDKAIEFELRHDVVFHNGDQLDADDVVYTVNWALSPSSGIKNRNAIEWIEKAEKIDQYKVRLIKKSSFPAALEYLASNLPIYPRHYHAKVGSKGFAANPVGTGPYKFVEYAAGSRLVLERNDQYFKDSPKGKPAIKTLVGRMLPEKNTEVVELMSGGLDWIWRVPPEQASKLKSNPNIVIRTYPTMRFDYLAFNVQTFSQMSDPKVRQAVAHVVNREAIASNLIQGGSKVVHAACYPTQFGCADDVTKYQVDLDKAKKLMAESSVPKGFSVDLFVYNVAGYRQYAEVIANNLKSIGINANITMLQYGALRDKIRTGEAKFALSTWGSSSINDIAASTSVFFKDTPDNPTKDAEVMKLLDEADNVTDPNVRKDRYKKALQRISSQIYWLPLWTQVINAASTKELNMPPNPDEIPRFYAARWN
jgi:peptide/nickel transport system substrate-binding protein